MGDQDYGHDGGYQDPMPGEGGSNVLGIVGFVLAFCLSPIGLLVSLFALTKKPRGFAIGGVVVGLLGTVIWGVVGYGFAAGWEYVKAGIEGVMDYKELDAAVVEYHQQNGSYPTSVSDLSVTSEIATDPWGNEYRIEVSSDGTSYQIVSAGIDGSFDTPDDLRLDGGMDENEVGEAFGESIEQHFKNK